MEWNTFEKTPPLDKPLIIYRKKSKNYYVGTIHLEKDDVTGKDEYILNIPGNYYMRRLPDLYDLWTEFELVNCDEKD